MAHYSYSVENENKISYIPCDVRGRYYDDFKVKYVAYGTKGYLKTRNNEIRECKCIGTIWQNIKGFGVMRFTQWLVAGFPRLIRVSKGNAPELIDEGVIYKTKYDAQVGSSNEYGRKEGHIEYNKETSVCEYLITKYNLTYNNFKFKGLQNDLLEIKLYYVTKDHSVASSNLWEKIEMYVDGSGFNIVIPDHYPYFPTESLCKISCAAIKPLKVFTFDDEETKPTKQNTKVKLTIEIDCDKLNDIKGIATIID